MTTLAWRILILALLLGALFGAGWHFGASSTQHRWDAATASQERDYLAKVAAAQATTATWQGKADQAAKERDDALQNLSAYRSSHPIGHVGLCIQPPKATPTVPVSPGGEPAGTTPAAVLLQEPKDIAPALDQLMAEADTINEAYRQCRAVYQALR